MDSSESDTSFRTEGRPAVLIVDDEPLVLGTLQRLVGSLDYEVRAAATVAEAIEVVEDPQQAVDAVLLDMTMKGLSLPEFSHAVRQLRPECRILLVSGYPLDERSQDLAERGVDGFLQKPVLADVLKEELARLLEHGGR